MPQCVAFGCQNRKEFAKKNNITFHKFPLDTATKNKWIAAVRRLNWRPTKNSHICSEHFKDSDFDVSSPFRVYVKKGAVPSIFPGFFKHISASKVHFAKDQFENKRSDKKKFLKWNGVPTICSVNNETVRRSTRKRKIIKEEDLDWPPAMTVGCLSESDSNDDLSSDAPSASSVVLTKSDVSHNKKLIENVQQKNESSKVGRRNKKLFDEEGFLKAVADAAASQIFASNDVPISTECSNNVSKVVPSGVKNLILKQLVPDLSDNVSCANKTESQNPNSSTDSEMDLIAVHKKQLISGNKLPFKSTLEDFAEVISEEKIPAPQLSNLHSKKTAVKKLVRVSTDNICRICGKLSDHLIPVHSATKSMHSIPTLINTYLPIQISTPDSGWPKNICELCLKYLTEWNTLYKKCKQIDEMFGKLLNKTPSSYNKCVANEDHTKSPFLDHNYCPSESCVSKENSKCNLSENTEIDRITKSNTLDDFQKSENEITVFSDNSNKIFVTTYTKNKKKVDIIGALNDDETSDLLQDGISEDDTIEETGLNKKHYKIGITLVKNKDCNKVSELNFNSLKSILMSKVDELFDLCTDETVGRSLDKLNKNDVDSSKCVKESSVETALTNDSNFSISENQDINVDENSAHVNDDESVNVENVNTLRKRKKGVKQTLKSKEKVRVKEMKREREDESSYLCSNCGLLIKTRKRFLSHSRLYHVQKVCRHCNITLPSLQEYRWHLRLEHVDKISNNCCEFCGATFIRRERLERHKLIIHNIGEYFYCNFCNKKCASKQQLHCHKNDVHNKLKNVCHTCNMNFVSHQSYLAHLRKKHGIDTWKRKTYPCTKCGKSFNRRTDMEIHSAKCDPYTLDKPKKSLAVLGANNNMYTCLICSVRINDLDVFKQHMNYHADDENIKNLVGKEEPGELHCTMCNYYFDLEKEMALHRFYVHQEPPFICKVSPDCNMTFWKRMSMTVHQMTYHKMRHNICKICSESFPDNRTRNNHMKTCHPNDNPHVCPICERCFCWESTLKTHMVIHSDVKTHKCHLCDKAFKLKVTLSRHLQYHQRKDQELKEKTELVEATDFLDIVENTEIIETETIPKQAFDMSSDGDQTLINVPSNLKVYTVFKCTACNILFTEKEMRDSHYYEAHVAKEDKIENIVNELDVHSSENVTEFLP